MDWVKLASQLITEDQTATPPKFDIPCLPDVVFRVVQASQQSDASANDIGKLIETDAALTCDLLKYVNSSAFMLRHKASTASRAVSMLGFKKTKLFILTIASTRMQEAVKSPLIVMKRFAVSSFERGLLSKLIARHLELDQDLAFSGAILQDLVLPTLTAELSPEYYNLVDVTQETGVDLPVHEQDRFGWDHGVAAAQIMKSWGFPDDIVCCVALHHDQERILADPEMKVSELLPVTMSALLGDLLNQSPKGMSRLEAIWSEVLPNVSIAESAELIQQQLHEMHQELHGHTTMATSLRSLVS